jgi:hypothetical protein
LLVFALKEILSFTRRELSSGDVLLQEFDLAIDLVKAFQERLKVEVEFREALEFEVTIV